MTTMPIATRADGPPVERDVARDLVRRGVFVAPALIGLSAAVWGVNGALSTAFAIGLVLVNFLFAAAIISWAAPISLGLLMGMTLMGYVLRLGLITAAVLVVKDFSWVALVPLGVTLIVTHLGLLLWETRYVSASLAFPGLAPGRRS